MVEKNNSRIILGSILLAVGVLFLLDQFNILSTLGLSSWFIVSLIWPSLLIYWGYRVFVRNNAFWGVVLMVLGSLTLIGRFVDVQFWNIFWPVLIIAGGVYMLFWKEKHPTDEFSLEESESGDDTIYDDVIFWGMDKRVTSDSFKGGEVNCIFGGGKLDLSSCKIVKDGAQLEINCVFGGLELILPQDCNLISDGTGVFGGWNSKVEEGKKGSPTLKVSGAAVFGGVDIKK